MLGVWGAGFDPPLQKFDFLGGQFSTFAFGGHSIIFVVGDDTFDQFTLGDVAWKDCKEVVVIGGGAFSCIESKAPLGFHASLACVLVGTMTSEALIGQDGADVACEINVVCGQQRLGNCDH